MLICRIAEEVHGQRKVGPSTKTPFEERFIVVRL